MIVLAAAFSSALLPAACPSREAIETELVQRGEEAARELFRRSEVSCDGHTLRVVLRDAAGTTLGMREVEAPATCDQRASLTAFLVAAWAKSWNETALAPLPRAPERPAPPATSVEAGLLAGADVDGAGLALAAGLLAGLQRTSGLGARLRATKATSRELALGPGRAQYAFVEVAIGPSLARARDATWLDVALLGAVERLALEGQGLAINHPTTRWSAAAILQGRVGLRFGHLRPWAGVSLSRSFFREELTLDDAPDRAVLSSWRGSLLLGLSSTWGE